MNITKGEAAFICECLKWGKETYVGKSAKYKSIPGYIENQYEPTVKRYGAIIKKLEDGSK
jgi:hypothetical protein